MCSERSEILLFFSSPLVFGTVYLHLIGQSTEYIIPIWQHCLPAAQKILAFLSFVVILMGRCETLTSAVNPLLNLFVLTACTVSGSRLELSREVRDLPNLPFFLFALQRKQVIRREIPVHFGVSRGTEQSACAILVKWLDHCPLSTFIVCLFS